MDGPLPFHHRLMFRFAALVWRCLLGLALAYLLVFAIPPWAPEVAVPSDQWNGGYSLSLLPILQLASGWPLCLEWVSVGTAIAPHG